MAAVVQATGPRASAPSSSFNSDSRGRKPRFSPKFRKNAAREKVEPKTLFQKYFKSVGPRTYAAQLKEAGNGNQFLVLTEGKRDPKTDELKKISLFVFSEDFEAFKELLRDTFKFIADHPVSDEVRKRQAQYWAKAKQKKEPQMNTDKRR